MRLGKVRMIAAERTEGGERVMKFSWKSILGIAAVAAIAFGTVAVRLQARPAAGGSFNLPFEAQWGTVPLAPGDYTFIVSHITSNGSIAVYRGNQAVGFVQPQVLDNSQDQGEKSELLCIRHDGEVSVRALRIPQVGTFYFPLSKGMSTLIARQPELIETVSIQVSGE